MTTDDAGSAQETEAAVGPAPAESASLHQARHRRDRRTRGSGRAGRYWAAWRAWRRSRPFWGGLSLILAGLELLAIPLSGVLVHGAIKLVIYIGIGGVFGVLIGVLLIASGIALWVNPAHRMFYGIAGIILGLASFPASNLGGFFLGMLLAIIGGSIGFAWTPAAAAPAPAAAGGPASPKEPSAGIGLVTGAGDETWDESYGADASDDDEEHPEEGPSDAAPTGEPGAELAGEGEPAGEPGLAVEGEPDAEGGPYAENGPDAELSAGSAAR